jgi:hypothetical protein
VRLPTQRQHDGRAFFIGYQLRPFFPKVQFYEEMALVSIHSLRIERDWQGPLIVFPIWSRANRRVMTICEMMADDERLNIQLGPPIRAVVSEKAMELGGGRTGMVTKTLIPFVTPFERTLLIDADTVVVKPIDDIFRGSAPLKLTAFEPLWSDSAALRKRISTWNDIAPIQVDRIRRRWDPAINTGVMVFDRPATQLVAWNELTMRGDYNEIPDEIAMQLLLPDLNYELLPDIWNFSPVYGNKSHRADAHIWHLHGTNSGKREDLPEWNEFYVPRLTAVKNGNFGHINKWPSQPASA